MKSFQCGVMLYIFEDNEAVIKMIIKGRSPTMRHVSRTHRVALDWLFDRINLDPKIQIKYVYTKHLTRRHIDKREVSHVMIGIIFCVCSTSAISVLQTVLRCNPKHTKIAIAGKGFTSLTRDNLVHNFIPMPQAIKISDAKAAVDKEWKKLETNSSMGFEKSQEQKGGYSGSAKRQNESPLCFIDGQMPPQKMQS